MLDIDMNYPGKLRLRVSFALLNLIIEETRIIMIYDIRINRM